MIGTGLLVTVDELLDETAARVLLAVESGDSIRRVSQRLQRPYETVRQAVNRLEDGGFLVYDDGLSVVAERARSAALELVAASAAVSPPSPSAAYVLPQFGDWLDFFARFEIRAGLQRRPPAAVDGSLQVVLDPRPELSVEHVEGYPVVPRAEAVAYAREHSAQCQSALSMLAELYDDLELDVV